MAAVQVQCPICERAMTLAELDGHIDACAPVEAPAVAGREDQDGRGEDWTAHPTPFEPTLGDALARRHAPTTPPQHIPPAAAETRRGGPGKTPSPMAARTPAVHAAAASPASSARLAPLDGGATRPAHEPAAAAATAAADKVPCPVCNMMFMSTEIERHADMCMDQLPTEPGASGPAWTAHEAAGAWIVDDERGLPAGHAAGGPSHRLPENAVPPQAGFALASEEADEPIECPQCRQQLTLAALAGHDAVCRPARTPAPALAAPSGSLPLPPALALNDRCAACGARVARAHKAGPCLHDCCPPCLGRSLDPDLRAATLRVCPVGGCGRPLSLFEIFAALPQASWRAYAERVYDSTDVPETVLQLQRAFSGVVQAMTEPIAAAAATAVSAPAPAALADVYGDDGYDGGGGHNRKRARKYQWQYVSSAEPGRSAKRLADDESRRDLQLVRALEQMAAALRGAQPLVPKGSFVFPEDDGEAPSTAVDGRMRQALLPAVALQWVLSTSGKEATVKVFLALLRNTFQAMIERLDLFQAVLQALDTLVSERFFLFCLDGPLADPNDPTPTDVGDQLVAVLDDMKRQATLYLEHAQRHADATADEGEAATQELALNMQARDVYERLTTARSRFVADFRSAAPALGPARATAADDTKKQYEAALKELSFMYVPNLFEGYAYANAIGTQHGGGGGDNGRMKRIHRELSSLPAHLPTTWGSSIFVRANEDRTDVLRALIIGPPGTPYQDGCFLFDIHLPLQYPNVPPHVTFRTTNGNTVRFNPNLYVDGKVCLSLLGTWAGPGWKPGTSTLAQVLLSIQSQVLNDLPYRNEPAYSNAAVPTCQAYNRDIRLLTARVAIMEQIPGPWTTGAGRFRTSELDDVLYRHFYYKRQAILEQLDKWAADALSQHQANNFPVGITTKSDWSWGSIIPKVRLRLESLKAPTAESGAL